MRFRNYLFPYIEHIDQVLPHIDDNFIVVHKEDYTVINYVLAGNDTFPTVQDEIEDHGACIRRECRGLIFDTNGKIISRPYHKFFNLGEREDHMLSSFDLSQNFKMLEKLDGSMIRPLYINGGLRLATKMGITEVSMQAEAWMEADSERSRKYRSYMLDCIRLGFTPIFEWCSNDQRIVLDYPEDRLVLTAVRDTKHGFYARLMLIDAADRGIDVVKSRDFSVEEALEEAKSVEGIEGWICRMDDGHMFKIKCDWYVRCHRSKEFVSRERNAFDAIINQTIDDVIPLLTEEDLQRVLRYQSQVNDHLHWYSAEMSVRLRDLIMSVECSPKRFALEVVPSIPKLWATYGFRAIQAYNRGEELCSSALEFVIAHAKNSVSTNAKFDAMKAEIFPNVEY